MSCRLSLTLIVKDESTNLPRCLTSVWDIADEIVVVDTGSADDTRDVARRHGARVFDFAWCDSFAAARNESVRHATGRWLLWLDADEYLDDANRAKLRALLDALPDEPAAYAMRQRSASAAGSATLVGQVRLFRNHPDLRWDYRVHEQILPALRRAGHAVRFADIFIEHGGYLDPALRRRKTERNLRLLLLDRAERPGDPFTLFNLGWSYADLGRPADAVPLLQESLRRSHPADSITPKLYALLTLCHDRLGQHDAAWGACRAGVVRCPGDAELLFLQGRLCRDRGDRAAARACWTRLLNGGPLTPDPSPPLRGRGGEEGAACSADGVFVSVDAGIHGPLVRHHLAALARDEGDFAGAESHWRAVLAESPDFLPARVGLAELCLRQSRWPELETILAELEREPSAALDAAILRGRAHLARREFAEAGRVLEGAAGRAPDALAPLIFLSHVLLQSGDEAAAEPVLRRIVGRDPAQAESWRNLAVMYRRRGRPREAIAAARAGVLHCPDDADLLLLYGVLLREGGDAVNAEACLLRLLECDGGPAPRRRAARHNLALVYRDAGRVREAAAHWKALLADDPDCADARRCLAECAPVAAP